MKILVYGFEPYSSMRKNISEEVIMKIRRQRNLAKVVFPVKFEKKLFLEKIRKLKPDLILGMGQHPRGNKIRIERKAVNLKKTSRKDKPQIIYKNRPKYQFLNLKLKKDKDSWISYDASTYVCNFSMYLISYYGHKKNIKFAFIHIPYNYKLKKAVKFVNHKINEITDF